VPAAPASPVVELLDDDFTNTWNCSVCTFQNSPEAFKCLMCDVRKGTSTRKPRINPTLVAQQVARQQQQIQQQALKATAKQVEKESKAPTTPEIKDSGGKERLEKTNDKKVKDGKRPVSPSTSSTASNEKRRFSDVDLPSPGPSISNNSGSSTTSKKKKKEKAAIDHHDGGSGTSSKSSTPNGKSKLKNVDLASALRSPVTVNNVTVIITEFQPKKKSSTKALSLGDSSHTTNSAKSSSVNSSKKSSSNTVSSHSDKKPSSLVNASKSKSEHNSNGNGVDSNLRPPVQTANQHLNSKS
jgi:YY1-associated factor 2